MAHTCIIICIMHTIAYCDTLFGALGEARRPSEFLAERLGDGIAEGAEIYAGDVMLSVRKLEEGEIREVGTEIFVEDRTEKSDGPA